MVNEAVKLNSQDPRVHSLRGGVLALAGLNDEAIRELGEAIKLDHRDSWTYALRGTLKKSSLNTKGATEDFTQAKKYAIMGQHVEYVDDPLGTASDNLGVDHASGSSRTGGTSERPLRQDEKTRDPEPQRIVRNMLEKMLIPKERDLFHPDYFWKREQRIEDLSGEVEPPVNKVQYANQAAVSLPEKDLEPGGLDDQEVLEKWSETVRRLPRSTQGSQFDNARGVEDDRANSPSSSSSPQAGEGSPQLTGPPSVLLSLRSSSLISLITYE